jgi:Trk K+ transport system NAD-binding subunit
VVDPGQSLAVMLEAIVLHPQLFSLLSQTDGDYHMQEVFFRSSDLEGHELRKIPLPGDALVLMVAREGELIVPRGYTQLQRGDLLTLVGSREAVERAAEILAP